MLTNTKYFLGIPFSIYYPLPVFELLYGRYRTVPEQHPAKKTGLNPRKRLPLQQRQWNQSVAPEIGEFGLYANCVQTQNRRDHQSHWGNAQCQSIQKSTTFSLHKQVAYDVQEEGWWPQLTCIVRCHFKKNSRENLRTLKQHRRCVQVSENYLQTTRINKTWSEGVPSARAQGKNSNKLGKYKAFEPNKFAYAQQKKHFQTTSKRRANGSQ